ncbi:MAG: hypothetical protein KJO77_06850 [Bacteroidia bacterium]|nr:hypothetical protein [Bacteroidia bacterium]NND51642.1 hypothetical protein [Flavobacteriaceae bacterium]
MELYRSRDFSAFFQDTFAFIKRHGKHFFKHFFIVNGILILVLMVLGYFFMQLYTEVLFGGMFQNDPNSIENYMNENGGLFILLMILFLTVFLIFTVLMNAYPALYLKLYNVNETTDFGTKAIVDSYKKNLGKLFIFLLSSILVSIPLMIVLGLLVFVLFITIIGIMVLPLVIGAFSLFFIMAFMEYLEDERGVWDCYGYSWKLMSSKFWAAVGSVGLFFLMSYLLQNIITIIAYVFGMVQFFVGIDNTATNPQDFQGTMSVVMIAMFVAGFLLGAFLNNIVLLNQGIVFYSLKEDNENINTKSIIDQIGSGE